MLCCELCKQARGEYIVDEDRISRLPQITEGAYELPRLDIICHDCLSTLRILYFHIGGLIISRIINENDVEYHVWMLSNPQVWDYMPGIKTYMCYNDLLEMIVDSIKGYSDAIRGSVFYALEHDEYWFQVNKLDMTDKDVLLLGATKDMGMSPHEEYLSVLGKLDEDRIFYG